jgi:hypothetical protein
MARDLPGCKRAGTGNETFMSAATITEYEFAFENLNSQQ